MVRPAVRHAGRLAAIGALGWGMACAAGPATPAPAPADAPPTALMQTWHPWQLDSLLVAWVLQQTRRPPPAFASVPRGSVIDPRIAIDTPDSTYRRSGQRTAFDEAVRLSGLQHPCLARLREAVRLVELAPWRRPEMPEIEAFEARVLAALPRAPTEGGLASAFAEVDRYCRDIR